MFRCVASRLRSWEPLVASQFSQKTHHNILDVLSRAPPSSSKAPLIKLCIGDPTYDGNLRRPVGQTAVYDEVVHSGKYDGYPPITGFRATQEAVCQYWTSRFAPEMGKYIVPENVVMGCGVSQCIQLTINAMCNPGDNVLLPQPYYPHYGTVCKAYDVEERFYKCLPDKDWEVDLEAIRRLRHDKTKALVLTNPSNPIGSNFSRKHVEDILKVAEELRLPIISDEIYAGMVFKDVAFTSVANFDSPVPRIILGGMSKTFVSPGWRVGWSLMVDQNNCAREIQKAISRLHLHTMGQNSISQAAVVHLLNHTPQAYYDDLMERLEHSATHIWEAFNNCPGLSASKPKGALYVLAKIHFEAFKDIRTCTDFFHKLLDEENVQVVPGECFGIEGYFRVVTTRPVDVFDQAFARINSFCERHRCG